MVRVTAADLIAFTTNLVQSTGVKRAEAEIVAQCLVMADLRGVESHGVSRLAAYVEALQRGMLNRQPDIRVDRLAAAIANVDGDNGLGPVVGTKAMETAIELALECGVGIVGARNSNHFGAGAFYVSAAAERGLIGIAVSNASPTMAVWGGRDPVLGTNPLAVGVPGGVQPSFLLDMATASIARGRLRLAEKKGDAIPEGLALTEEGHPALTAVEAMAGVLLPFGGVRGSGIALLIDLLSGVLTGAGFGHGVRNMYMGGRGTANVGHFFLAINIAAFMPLDVFKRRYDEWAATLRASRPALGFAEVLIPGERAAEETRRRQAEGIPLTEDTTRNLKAAALEYGIEVPFG